MAHWCNNFLKFTGGNVSGARDLFSELELLQHHSDMVVPEKYKDDFDKGICNIYVGHDGVSYETKWAPNIDDMLLLASDLKFSFNLFYDELGNSLYGEYQYDHETDSLWERAVDEEFIEELCSDLYEDDLYTILDFELGCKHFAKCEKIKNNLKQNNYE